MFSKLIDLPSYIALKIGLSLRHLQIDNFELILVILVLICLVSTIIYKINKNKLDENHPVIKVTAFFNGFTYVILFVLILRSVFFVPFKVSESDLIPEITSNSHVVVNRISLGLRLPLTARLIAFRQPERFEIIQVRWLYDIDGQKGISQFFGRVIGFAGDTIVLEANSTKATITSINGEKTKYHFTRNGPISRKKIEFVVPENKVFVMANSYDVLELQDPTFNDVKEIVGVVGFVF
ncbi:MAG: hypothetical protein HRU38_08415 [Saccharospirillaceae bacterium]|nr:S26 family signal peptidase [Pseudomonadales bacterium]NRB78677.1 hypothetical protein [Saccharospirillaceae bacterium]